MVTLFLRQGENGKQVLLSFPATTLTEKADVAADQLETVEILLRHRKSDDGGIISRDKIFFARNDLPLLTLQKFAVTGVLKHFSEIFYRLKTGGAVIQELDELLIY